jgi:hypothetical protein
MHTALERNKDKAPQVETRSTSKLPVLTGRQNFPPRHPEPVKSLTFKYLSVLCAY